MSKKSIWLTVGTVLLVAMMVLPVLADNHTVPLNSAHVGATNPGFGTGSCPTPPAGQEGWYGWHFIMPGNNNFTSLTVEFQNAGIKSADPFPGGVFVASPDNSHAYIWTPTPDTLLAGTATSDGENAFFNLSHVCPGDPDVEHLTVSKTVNTAYTREYFWDIAKEVETENGYTHDGSPKVWLYTDGRGDETATWTVDVTYEGHEDSAWNVSGDITIENDGDLDAVITSVEDILAGNAIPVSCPVTFPYTLTVGDTLTCTYDEDGYVEGNNVATVATERDTYGDTESIVWGDPTNEINKTVNVKDVSDLFGEVDLGSVTAPNGDTFTYTKHFTWADYGANGCGDFVYDNTATIVETGQSASATLKVNVQCYIYETAFGLGPDGRCFLQDGFSRWGWTNPLGAEETIVLDLWAGAGQCDTSKGTHVGTVTVTASGGNVTFEYDIFEAFLLDETHSYAGSTEYPQVKQGKKTVSTVAPGQYYIQSPFTGGWAIAHAVVGIPDPNFGP